MLGRESPIQTRCFCLWVYVHKLSVSIVAPAGRMVKSTVVKYLYHSQLCSLWSQVRLSSVATFFYLFFLLVIPITDFINNVWFLIFCFCSKNLFYLFWSGESGHYPFMFVKKVSIPWWPYNSTKRVPIFEVNITLWPIGCVILNGCLFLLPFVCS